MTINDEERVIKERINEFLDDLCYADLEVIEQIAARLYDHTTKEERARRALCEHRKR